MHTRKFLGLVCITLLVAPLIHAHDELTKMTQFDEYAPLLAHQLPAELAGKPIVHLRTLAIQKDTFSCGYHALFNAVALDRVVQSGFINFEQQLRSSLSDKNLFYTVCKAIKEQTAKNKPLNGKEISDAAQQFSCGSRLLSLFLSGDKQLMIPSLFVQVTHPLSMSKTEIEALVGKKRQEMVDEKITQLCASIKDKPSQGIYFICNVGNHWVTYSLINNAYAQPKLYLIGAWNEPIHDVMKWYALKLLSYAKVAR